MRNTIIFATLDRAWLMTTVLSPRSLRYTTTTTANTLPEHVTVNVLLLTGDDFRFAFSTTDSFTPFLLEGN